MRLERYRTSSSFRPRWELFGRSLVVLAGLAVIVGALAGAVGPYRQTRQFHHVAQCEQAEGADCFDSEIVSLAGRNTWETTDSSTNGTGGTETYYEITWQRRDGSRQTHDVKKSIYDVASSGQQATLRLWRDEAVGVTVADQTDWFLPNTTVLMGFYMFAAHLGLGILLWGLLFGWWDGFGSLALRVIAWWTIGVLPIYELTHALAYGVDTDVMSLVSITFLFLFFTAISAWMLFVSVADPLW